MTTIQITRKRVLKAISSEPLKLLKHGSFIWGSEDEFGNELNPSKIGKDCPVCAVGAVMRSVLDPNQSEERLCKVANNSMKSYCAEPEMDFEDKKQLAAEVDYIAKKAPMAALSQMFEGLCHLAERRSKTGYISRHQMRRIRQNLIVWAKRSLPETMKINLNGAKPAKDVKVI